MGRPLAAGTSEQSGAIIPREFLDRPSTEVAPELLGCVLEHESADGLVAVRLTEVEAYTGATDPASHAYRGRTARNAVMFGPAGHAYVYLIYGLYWCLNFVCEPEGVANAVLIRALEPTDGIPVMQRRRKMDDVRLLCAGPGRLCEALGVTRAHDGMALDRRPFRLFARAHDAPIAIGRRIGITKAADKPWRYGLAGSRFLSKPFRR